VGGGFAVKKIAAVWHILSILLIEKVLKNIVIEIVGTVMSLSSSWASVSGQ